ncbi:MAG: ATP-binding protein [Candidatus Omnitrophica bacterium]|nr:ATP-binding protein [Candidatus Omnitrophota bacterium]
MPHLKKTNIRTKFFIAAGTVLLCAVIAISVIEIVTISAVYVDSLERNAAMVAKVLRSNLYKNLEVLPLEGISGMSGYIKASFPEERGIAYIYVTDAGHKILYHSRGETMAGRVAPPYDGKFDHMDSSRFKKVHVGEFFEVILPIVKGASVIGTVRVGVASSHVEAVVRKVIARNALIFSLVLVISTISMYLFFAAGIEKPMTRLARRLARLSALFGIENDPDKLEPYQLEDLAVSFELIAETLEKKTVSEDYVHGVMKEMSDAMIVTDQKGQIMVVNKPVSDILGYQEEELKGRDIRGFITQKDMTRFGLSGEGLMKVASYDLLKAYDVSFKKKDGGAVAVLLSASSVVDGKGELKGTVWTLKDISSVKESEDELKRLNEDLRRNERAVLNILADLKTSHEDLKNSYEHMVRQEKLASLGRLVSDMAHEVNNPLMIISGRAQLAALEGGTREELEEHLEIIVDQCERAKEIIERLLVFSRPSKGEVALSDLNKEVEFIVKLLEYQYALFSIKIETKYDRSIPKLLFDQKQIHEVFMNVIKNAAEAMPKGGVIKVSTFMKGAMATVEVKDTGHGISGQELKNIFEPFYTTKENGTGLGLPVCYGIMEAHGGDIKVVSSPGKGTTVTLLLPVRSEETGG